MPSSSSHNSVLRFGAFEFDPQTGILCKNGRSLALQPQPAKVLSLLVSRPGELITREELQLQVWGKDTFVDFEHNINFAVRQIRAALKDDAEKPRFIETLPRRGYRFIATVEEVAPSPPGFPAGPPVLPAERHSVGREKEGRELRTGFESAVASRGLLLCVAGEAGIGKTTLVEDFLADLAAGRTACLVGRGRCSERLAGTEAYLPILEAFESLLRGDAGRSVARVMKQAAPMWYSQVAPLSGADPSGERLMAEVGPTSQERLKRELTAFFREVSGTRPLVLFFEDMQWADVSTVDLLAYIGAKLDSIRVLIVVTYRPSELLPAKHPFLRIRLDLQTRGICREIPVEFLSRDDIESYLAIEFPLHRFPPDFSAVIHTKTEGNALFMVDLLRYLKDQKVIAEENGRWALAHAVPTIEREVPESVRSMIQRKIDQLGEADRSLLVAASVQGYDFESAVISKALGNDAGDVEERLQALDRLYAFVRPISELEFPDGTWTVRYRFVHVLYQNALYSTLSPTRRAALSAALAHALEALYSDKSSTIASQLGFLYETARDFARASDYFRLAAQNAARVYANQEAIMLAQRGLALLTKFPDSAERTRKELDLQVTLAFSLLWTQGYAAPETGRAMARARELCRGLGDTAVLFPVTFGLWTYYLTRGDLKSARETAEHLLSIAQGANDSVLLLGAHTTSAFTFHNQGDLVSAHKQFEEASRHYDPAQHSHYLQLYRLDPGVQAESAMVQNLWLLGFPDQARRKLEETLALAHTVSIPLSLTFCQVFAAFLYHDLRQPEEAREIGEACIALCNEQAMVLQRAWVVCPYGWAVAELGQVEEGISQIRAGLDTQLSMGAEVARPQFQAMLAEALWHAGRTEEAVKAVEDGLDTSSRNGYRYYDAKLLRLRGELFNTQGKTMEAEACFQKAILTAHQQASKSLELRASTSLARLWQKQGKRKEAQQLLGEIYAWFTEGFDTADLREAASLLDELA